MADTPRGSSGFTRQWGHSAPTTTHHRVTLTGPERNQRAKEIIFENVQYYTEAFLSSIQLACMLLAQPPSIPVLPIHPDECPGWRGRPTVSSGAYGDTSCFEHDGKKYLVKHIRQITGCVTIAGVPPAADRSEEAVREGAVLLSLSVIGFPSMIHRNLAFFVDVSLEPPIVYIGMEFIDGCVLEKVEPPLSLCERLLAVADLAFLLEYFALYKISHNDLHLKNLMIRTSTRRIVVIDYGAVSTCSPVSSDFAQFKAIANYLLSADACNDHMFFKALVRKFNEAPRIFEATEALRKALDYGPYFFGFQVAPRPGMQAFAQGTQMINFPMPTDTPPRIDALNVRDIRMNLSRFWARIDLQSAVYLFFCRHYCTRLETQSPYAEIILRWFAKHFTLMSSDVLTCSKQRATSAILPYTTPGNRLYVHANFALAALSFANSARDVSAGARVRKHLQALLNEARDRVLSLPSLPRECSDDGEIIAELLDRADEEKSLLFLECCLFPSERADL